MAKRVAIIGSGVSGLASAVWLARFGYEVEIYEKNTYAGGKLSEMHLGNYRFDRGPSLFTLPQMIENLFSLCDVPMEEQVPYTRLDMVCKYFYGDGTIIRSFAEPDRFAREVEETTGEPAHHVTRFLNHCSELYDITSGVFIFNNLHDPKNLMTRHAFRALMKGWKLEPFTTMHQSNVRRFRDKRVVQLFDRYATYNGSNPYTAPATLNVIAHLEHNLGAFFPDHGMVSIVKGLVALADRMGVRFRMNTPVTSVVLDRYTVTGVTAGGNDTSCDFVVSAIDVYSLYSRLLPKKLAPGKLWKTERSSSALIFYWGIRGTFPQLELHNILFSENYREEFEHIFRKKEYYSDPTVYIFVSSKQVKTDAPVGCENWFVMINAPAGSQTNWEEVRPVVRKNIIDKINKILKINIEGSIEVEAVVDPATIEQDTGSAFGSIYGTSSNSRFAAFNRHPNRRDRIKGLYFAGGSAHPGGGIPLCMASAAIVSEMIVNQDTL